MDEKLSGSYYTPQKTVHFIYNYLQQQHKPIKSIFEPSAGDGRFIRLFSKSNSVDNIVGVELYQEKVQAINERILSPKVTMIAADFLEYSSTCKAKFDLVVGNPPYINIKNMDKKFLEAARSLCQSLNLPESLIQNAWVAFVIVATQLLSKTGTVFFVLPTEFLQVQYAEKLRGFLEKKFNTIHILSFEERMFPEIEQEACLVYLTNENQGLPYISYRQYAKLDSKTPILESRIERNKPLKKWSNAVLSDEEIDLLNRITNQYTTIAKLSDSAPGIVTGANNKFILTKEEVDQYECAQYVKPIISKGIMAKNKFEVNHALISELASAGKKVYLLDLVGTKPDELPVSLKNYLSIVASTKRNGVEIQKSYKCSKRKPWYGVPIVKSGRVIFFKRYDLCPRISTNPAEIYTTDIAYNLRLHEGIDPESLVFCFYNSLTLAQCEFVGRYYAGGVSELTPNEFRTISVPYRQIKPCDIERVKTMFSNNVNLNQIVAFVNSKTLESDLTTEEISRLNTIRVKLIGRRK